MKQSNQRQDVWAPVDSDAFWAAALVFLSHLVPDDWIAGFPLEALAFILIVGMVLGGRRD